MKPLNIELERKLINQSWSNLRHYMCIYLKGPWKKHEKTSQRIIGGTSGL